MLLRMMEIKSLLQHRRNQIFSKEISVNVKMVFAEVLCNTLFYYTEIVGDFMMRVNVSHDFKKIYDALSIMVMKDMDCRAKACFEYTDFGTHAVVSV